MISAEFQALLRYRMQQANESLASARLLFDGGHLKDAVNRAYYAMFYATLALLISEGKRAAKHMGIIALFDVEFVKAGKMEKQYSEWLHRIFDLRQDSDYREMFEVSTDLAADVLEKANAFVTEAISRLEALLST